MKNIGLKSSDIGCHMDIATERDSIKKYMFLVTNPERKGNYSTAPLLGQVQGSFSFRWLSVGDRLGQGRVESLKVREAVVGWMKENRGLPSAETGGTL